MNRYLVYSPLQAGGMTVVDSCRQYLQASKNQSYLGHYFNQPRELPFKEAVCDPGTGRFLHFRNQAAPVDTTFSFQYIEHEGRIARVMDYGPQRITVTAHSQSQERSRRLQLLKKYLQHDYFLALGPGDHFVHGKDEVFDFLSENYTFVCVTAKDLKQAFLDFAIARCSGIQVRPSHSGPLEIPQGSLSPKADLFDIFQADWERFIGNLEKLPSKKVIFREEITRRDPYGSTLQALGFSDWTSVPRPKTLWISPEYASNNPIHYFSDPDLIQGWIDRIS